MCGVVGIYGFENVAQDVYDGLITLQHRGQDAAGMITYDGKFHWRRGFGLVKDVFHTRHMQRLKGYVGLGHTRYATIGTGEIQEVQPFLSPSTFGVAFVHNGNLFNSHELKQDLFDKDHRLVNSDSDGEVILNMFTKAVSNQDFKKLKPEHIYKAVKSVYDRSKGAYSVVTYIAKHGMVAFRDPHGIRPLLFGKRRKGLKTEYIFASESVTLDILGFELIGDVGPGEVIFIDEETRKVHRKFVKKKKAAPCIFEYVYFARPDSMINNISVYKSRLRMGQKLAQRIKKMKLEIDVVMPVPDSSRAAALAIATELGLPYREGLIKNRYIGRTFIMPGQRVRKKSIRYKLNPMPLEIEGKKVLLVDDSVVRGNTSRQIIELVRGVGADKIYFASYSPPIKWPNLYGIDIPTRDELIANNLSIDEIGRSIGADKMIYGDVKDMFDACQEGNKDIQAFDMSCFDGVYVTGDIDEEVLEKQAESRTGERGCGQIEDGVEPGEEAAAAGQMNLV